MHRDLAARNVLINNKDECKVIWVTIFSRHSLIFDLSCYLETKLCCNIHNAFLFLEISDFGLSLMGKLHKEKKMARMPVR